jgi:hypothetical protein
VQSWLVEVKGFARGDSKITCVYGEVPPGCGCMYRQAEICKVHLCSQNLKFAATLGTQRGEFGIWPQDVETRRARRISCVFAVRVARLRFIAFKSSVRDKQDSESAQSDSFTQNMRRQNEFV